MFRSVTQLSLVVLLAAQLTGCGDSVQTPAQQMAAADEAMGARDHAAALELYDGLINWKGEGEVGSGDRFKASLESVKCLISLNRAKAGVDRYAEMYGKYGELDSADAHKHTMAVLRTLVDQKTDANLSIEFLKLAQAKHPDKQDNFGKVVEKLKQQGLSNEQLEALAKLGYL